MGPGESLRSFLVYSCFHSHVIVTGFDSWRHANRPAVSRCEMVTIGVGDGGRGGGTCPPPLKFGTKYFSGNCYVKFGHFSGKNYVKFGHFVNFSYIFSGQKCRAPPPKVDWAPISLWWWRWYIVFVVLSLFVWLLTENIKNNTLAW